MKDLRYSYDMLGEGARTDRTRCATSRATRTRSRPSPRGSSAGKPVEANDGISIKLRALHPRYEDAHRERVMAELVPRVWTLCERAARANINLAIDAEEMDRLEISLDVFEALAAQVSRQYPQWQGLRPRASVVSHPRAGTGAARGLARAPLRSAADVSPRQGRVLGRRDQARSGDGHAPLPCVHAQAPHRHLLPGLRARDARCAGRDLPAVRHAQRRQDRRDPADGFSHGRLIRTAAPARDGRGDLRRGAAQPTDRVSRLCARGPAPRPARLPGAPPAGERRQQFLRAPARR